MGKLLLLSIIGIGALACLAVQAVADQLDRALGKALSEW